MIKPLLKQFLNQQEIHSYPVIEATILQLNPLKITEDFVNYFDVNSKKPLQNPSYPLTYFQAQICCFFVKTGSKEPPTITQGSHPYQPLELLQSS